MISNVNNEITAKSRRRKLTIQDVQAIADCVATMKLTETEACLHLDIPVKQWQCWKSREKHSANFESIITRTRAGNIAGLISKIRNAGEDYEITLPNGKTVTKRGDWRALDSILTKVEPRFSPQTTSAPAQVTIQISTIHEQLKRVIGFSNDSDNHATIDSGALLLPDSVRTADEHIQELKSNPTKICMPIRKVNK